MTSLNPLPSPAGEWGLDYAQWVYPAVNVGVRIPMETFTYPPRHAMTPEDRAMIAAVSTDMAHRTLRFNTPVISALEGQHAALHGWNDVVDHVASTTLGLQQPWKGQWREAVSTALLGDWVQLVGDENASLIVPRHLKREAKRAHEQAQPLWERKSNGHRVKLLDEPVADGLTLCDLVADSDEPNQDFLRTVIDDPRLQAILGALDPEQRDVVLAWVRDPSVRTWADAAYSAGAACPDELGEQVRRKVKRLAARERATTAQEGAV